MNQNERILLKQNHKWLQMIYHCSQKISQDQQWVISVHQRALCFSMRVFGSWKITNKLKWWKSGCTAERARFHPTFAGFEYLFIPRTELATFLLIIISWKTDSIISLKRLLEMYILRNKKYLNLNISSKVYGYVLHKKTSECLFFCGDSISSKLKFHVTL